MQSSFCKNLALVLSCCAGFALHGADTNPPVVVTAGSFDGQTIGVCFSEALDVASATNVANYRISDIAYAFPLSDTDFTVVEAGLRPDQRSVALRLSKQFPASGFSLSVSNVRDTAGNAVPTGFITHANNLRASDVGIPGVDPRETGSLFFCGQLYFDDVNHGYEAVAGASGLEATNDGFHFISEQSRGPLLILRARVTYLEAINRLSSAGLMLREDLTPGSRFFSVTVTPPDVPARDGSGNGANAVQVRYRSVANNPSVELISTNAGVSLPYPDVWLEIFRNEQYCVARFSTNYLNWSTLGEFTFADPFPDQVLAGMTTFSHNNAAGFTSKATYSNAGLLRGDVFTGPQLLAQGSGSNLVLRWTEPFEFPYFLLSAPEPSSSIFWELVTNQVNYQITPSNVQATVTVPIGNTTRFFGLRMSRW